MKNQSLVGVVGYAASGKDTVSGLLQHHSYCHLSVSDTVRDEIYAQGLTPSRELQTMVANQYRADFSPGYWIDRTLQKNTDPSAKVALSGLYSPLEGEYLTKSLGGIMIGIVVGIPDNPATRYERLLRRSHGSRDNLTYEEFMAAHNRENAMDGIHGANVSELLKSSRFIINNSFDNNHLAEQVETVMRQIDGGEGV